MMHNIDEIRAEAHDLMQELIEVAHFDKFLSGEQSFYDWLHTAKYTTQALIPNHIGISCGCTRMVFWDQDTCDYVFKLNIYPEDIDYGASEVFIYDRACEKGLEDCFAWTAKVIDDAKFPVYAMSFCEVDSSVLSAACYQHYFEDICTDEGYDLDTLTDEQRSHVEHCIGDYADSNGMLDYVYTIYDNETFNRLYDFLEEYSVNDVHCGNWGYYNGQLVLTDYAGYERDLVGLAEQNAKGNEEEAA